VGVTTVMNHVVQSEALYLRSHKREPLLVQGIVVAIVIATSTIVLARLQGASAVAVGYFLFGGVLNLAWATYIFVTKRQEWYKICS
jgi:hypothetical protein